MDSDFVVPSGKGCFYIGAGLSCRDVSGTIINREWSITLPRFVQ